MEERKERRGGPRPNAGGARPGAGRKPLGDTSKCRSIRMTDEEYDWVRQELKIRRAKA